MALPSFDTALRILALQAVRSETDWDARYRRICRWYSQTFHTPLSEVFELDEVFVLQHHYEHHFETFDDQEWRKEVQDTLETPEERRQRIADEAASDKELIRRAMQDRQLLDSRRKQGGPTMGSEIASEPSKELEVSADERLRQALGSMPTTIEPAKKPGDKVQPRVEQIDMPGFAPDAFEVKLGEAPIDDDIPMGLNMPPAAPKKRRK